MHKASKYVLILILLVGGMELLFSAHTLRWDPSLYPLLRPQSRETIMTLRFPDALYEETPFTPLPSYLFKSDQAYTQNDKIQLKLDSTLFRVASSYESHLLDSYQDLISSDFKIISDFKEFRHQYYVSAYIFPIRKNPISQQYELLTSFTVQALRTDLSPKSEIQNTLDAEITPTRVSKLSHGPTLKMGVSTSGIYKVTFEDLSRMNLLSQSVPSPQIALYGQKAGMLPTINTQVYDDLASLPLQMEDGQDGQFGPGDYFIFYGEAPTVWSYKESEKFFTHGINSYSDQTFYFVGTQDPGPAKRISTRNFPPQEGKETISSFTDYLFHEKDLENITHSGQTWYGESFSNNADNKSFEFSLPDLSQEGLVSLLIEATALTQSGSARLFVQAGNAKDTLKFAPNSSWGFSSSRTQLQTSSPLSLKISYQKYGNALKAYLNFITLNYQRDLRLFQGELKFRSPSTIENIQNFRIENTPANTRIWDITDPTQAYLIGKSTYQNGTTSFSAGGDKTLHEFIAFDGSLYKTPSFIVTLKSQNLHGLAPAQYLVVTPSVFEAQAQALAKIHQERDGYSTLVANVSDIYQEFSAGIPDPSAIRMFAKMLYDRAAVENISQMPKYLLLFGKCTYDYRNILKTASNLIPSWEVPQAISDEGMVTDDLFALLGNDEGISASLKSDGLSILGTLDIAVGRLPAKTVSEAKQLLHKIDLYSTPYFITLSNSDQRSGNYGGWRNQVTFVSDDGFEKGFESGHHIYSSVVNASSNINVEKLYADAATQVSTAVSTTYPEINTGLKNRMNAGALFVGYIGHSGWDAWGDEKYLTLDDINQWKEILSFPMMFASSCSFSLYDQPTKTSGAEETVLHPNGGAISMIATTRTAYEGGIESIYKGFITYAVSKKNGVIPTIGDAMLSGKNLQGPASSVFALLGDPGLKVALPRYNVKTLEINGKSTSQILDLDTLKAFSQVEVKGQIEDEQGQRLETFQGKVEINIFDKSSKEITMGHYNARENRYNEKEEYEVQNALLYKGSADVKEGIFSFRFIVPKDIKYNYGKGKISYYAYSDSSGDAGGSFDQITVGGFNSEVVLDTSAPIIKLYINKDNFMAHCEAGASPIFYAEIKDQYGLNTTGVGIGHDMTLTIDGNHKNSLIVNNRFAYKTNSFTEGTLTYPLDLSEGPHTIELKVWNIFNVSSTAVLKFGVNKSDLFTVTAFRVTPNPAPKEGAFNFYFTHNGVGGIDHYEIWLYDLQGTLVASLKGQEKYTYGYSVGPISFESFKAERGSLQRGAYVARVVAYNKMGDRSEKVCRLIIAY